MFGSNIVQRAGKSQLKLPKGKNGQVARFSKSESLNIVATADMPFRDVR